MLNEREQMRCARLDTFCQPISHQPVRPYICQLVNALSGILLRQWSALVRHRTTSKLHY